MATETDRDLSIELLPITALKPDPGNPRQHSDRQIKHIAQSIDAFGFNVPILIDRNNNVLAGHGRLLACRKLGRREVPTIRLDLTEAAARAFMIADNRLAELAAWDERLLAGHLYELSELTLDFSLEATGFTMGEIDLQIEGLSSEPTASDDKADRLPPLPNQPPVSQPGDLWLLGKHRVYCGNALDAGAYQTLMQGERALMVFTDPPYNVRIDGHASGLGAIHHRELAMASGEMSEAEFTAFLTLVCTLLVRNSTDGSIHFVCTDYRSDRYTCSRYCCRSPRSYYRSDHCTCSRYCCRSSRSYCRSDLCTSCFVREAMEFGTTPNRQAQSDARPQS